MILLIYICFVSLQTICNEYDDNNLQQEIKIRKGRKHNIKVFSL